MARRTRSLNELPGHIRVPILRRKDTQRTKDRLAAGQAGMEELKSLRQLQQQLVGETVARAGDKRQERKHVDRNSPEAQHPINPRQFNPHPRSCFYGQSMDSISEEADGSTNMAQRGTRYKENNNDENNNMKDSQNGSFISKAQFGHGGSTSRHFNLQSKLNTSHHVLTRQKHIHNNHEIGQENHKFGNGKENGIDVNPVVGVCSDSMQHQREWNQNVIRDENDHDPPVPFRRRAMSLRPGCPESMTMPNRQRSFSVDMGQCGTNSFNSPSYQVTLSKHGNGHAFSSLTSINIHNSNGRSHVANLSDHARTNDQDRSRLSQSMSQLNDICRSHNNMHSSSLKRRGSLTWDSLLKSMGIHNSESNNSHEEVDNESTRDISTPTNHDSDEGVFDQDTSKKESDFITSRKKGRSMSFTCSNHTPLLDPRCYRVQAHNDNDNSNVENDEMINTNISMQRSIRPILRRASIQCEAVLTQSKRVVNPIQDVDINSFNNPGPLHAVMLQYRGYKPSPKSENVKETTVRNHKHDTDFKRTVMVENGSGPENARGTNNATKQCTPSLLNEIAECDDVNNKERQESSFHNISGEEKEDSLESIPSQNNKGGNAKSYSNLQSHSPENVNTCSEKLLENPLQSRHGKSMPSLITTLDKNALVDASIISNDGNIDVQLEDKEAFLEQTNHTRVTHCHDHCGKCEIIEHDFIDVNNIHASNTSYQTTDINTGSDRQAKLKCEVSNVHSLHNDAISHKHSTRTASPIQLGLQTVDRLKSDKISSVSDYHLNHSFVQNKPQGSTTCQLNSTPLTADSLHGIGLNNKRYSIFSDVSLISDASAKTPSSSASVFSDVSMVSDEGYVTSESFSPDHKLHIGKTNSPLKTYEQIAFTNVTQTTHPTNEDDKNNHYNSFRKLGTTFDNNGAAITKYTEYYPKDQKNTFTFENNGVNDKENQPSTKLERCGNQFIARRQSVKQTAV